MIYILVSGSSSVEMCDLKYSYIVLHQSTERFFILAGFRSNDFLVYGHGLYCY